MTRRQLVVVALGVAVAVAVAAFLLFRGDGDDDAKDKSDSSTTPTGTAPPVVADETWCEGWQNLVALQGQYVAGPTPEIEATLLAVIADLHAIGVPESLDPAGYTELNAVLDDVRASVDPSFTPTAVPSEPADVGPGHDHGDEDEAEEEHVEAPFGTWLADHCAP